MNKEIPMVNVLIKDGNRTVSWDHLPKENVSYVLKSHGFKPSNLIAINFKAFTGELGNMKVCDCGLTKYKGIDRVFFILKQDEKKEEGKQNDNG